MEPPDFVLEDMGRYIVRAPNGGEHAVFRSVMSWTCKDCGAHLSAVSDVPERDVLIDSNPARFRATEDRRLVATLTKQHERTCLMGKMTAKATMTVKHYCPVGGGVRGDLEIGSTCLYCGVTANLETARYLQPKTEVTGAAAGALLAQASREAWREKLVPDKHGNVPSWSHWCPHVNASATLSYGSVCSCGRTEKDVEMPGSGPVVRRSVISDERLRAECERRHMLTALKSEKGDWVRAERFDDMVKDRDYERRRADEFSHLLDGYTQVAKAFGMGPGESTRVFIEEQLAKANHPLMLVPANLPMKGLPENYGVNPTRYEQSQDTREKGPSAAIAAVKAERDYANEAWGLADVDLLCDDEEPKR